MGLGGKMSDDTVLRHVSMETQGQSRGAEGDVEGQTCQ